MSDIDKDIVNIDLDDASLSLEVEIAMRQFCDERWEWDQDDAIGDRKPNTLLWLVTGGAADLWVNGCRHVVQRGDFCVMPSCGFKYKGRHDLAAPLEVSWLFFWTLDREGKALRTQGLDGLPFFTQLQDMPFIERIMSRLIDSKRKTRRESWLRCLLEEVRLQAYDYSIPQADRAIYELSHRIQSNPELFRNLGDMCREISISADYLIRQFRRCLGVTPIELLIQSRIETARAMLSVSNLSIKQVAARLRYSDSFCFSRQFKSRVGVSPSRYRRKISGEVAGSCRF